MKQATRNKKLSSLTVGELFDLLLIECRKEFEEKEKPVSKRVRLARAKAIIKQSFTQIRQMHEQSALN